MSHTELHPVEQAALADPVVVAAIENAKNASPDELRKRPR